MKFSLILLGIASFTAGVVYAAQAGQKGASETHCPELAADETEQDCPWAGVARELIAEGKAGRNVSKKLSALLPELDRRLQADATRQAWKALWGRSINFDEFVRGEIVDPKILRALADRMKITLPLQMIHIQADAPSMAPPAMDSEGHALIHAGLEHTYGYLFSLLKTSFGYKRARWVNGEIEKGLGLPVGTFSPLPAEGTLFSNVTFLMGQIAFRKEPKKIELLKRSATGLPKALREYNFANLKPTRLNETLEAKDSTGDVRTVTLHTDFVPFPKSPEHSLLVYSVTDPSQGGSVLITAFPVERKFVEQAMAPADLGTTKPIKTRYNAFVEGVTGRTLQGKRTVE